MHRFVVVVEGVSSPTINGITARFDTTTWGVWKQIGNMWLVTDTTKKLTTQTLYNWIMETPEIAKGNLLILRVDSGSTEHWGLLETAAWPWFATQWK